MTSRLFSELGLSPSLLKAIDRLGYEKAAPIQSEAIPLIMAGSDVVGQSQTGSGKTAAFGIPAVESVDPHVRAVQVIILCPTRELAVQVAEEIFKLSMFKSGVRSVPIYGGQSYDRQIRALKEGAQIVVGTPGRILDHIDRRTLALDQVKMVVLDEADEMLDMGFRDDIEQVLKTVPTERQFICFSATMAKAIMDLINKFGRDPKAIRIEHKVLTVPTVEQAYYEIRGRSKTEALTRLIDIHDLKLGIIFCNTKRMVDDLTDELVARGYSADRIHGDMSQAQRDRVMSRFRNSGLEFLVATDVAARGIDVDNIEVVFNYDLPWDEEDYVHRIGRTGRVGRSGRAISFASGREVFQIRVIERYTNTRIHRGKAPTAGEVVEARANVFLDQLRAILKSGEFKRQDQLIERLLEEGFSSTDITSAVIHQLQDGAQAKAVPSERASQRSEQPRYRQDREERSSRPPRMERSSSEVQRSRHSERPVHERPTERARPSFPRHTTTNGLPRRAEDRRPLPTGVAQGAAKEARPSKPFSPAPKPKPSRRTPDEQTRLFMNVGAEMGVGPGDIVGAILGETGLPATVVGTVDVRERHVFVDVASEHANSIISKLNRTQIRGRKVKVKVA